MTDASKKKTDVFYNVNDIFKIRSFRDKIILKSNNTILKVYIGMHVLL